MRVISGVAKGRKLVSFKGSDIRPTSDRARESLFNIIGERAKSCSFLDLYAGSGAMGIEALSRGAEKVVFVENQAESISLIKKNLEKCNLLDLDYEVIQQDVLIFLKTTMRQVAATAIRHGKPNRTVSKGKQPEGLRPGKAEIKWSYRSSQQTG